MEQEVTAQLAGMEEKTAQLLRRVDRLEEAQTALNRLATAVEVLATRQETMGKSVQRLNEKLDDLEHRPVKRWDGLVDKLLLALAGAFAAFLLGGQGAG
ncbi:MAG: hypothetical protein E7429_07430 [Ruminococcaceae bacterium]|nr:hypothetical protein [Oscillospiraceae bacterium]MBE6996533.1 hypothetical protein [Oscillospiraceae bacterium]